MKRSGNIVLTLFGASGIGLAITELLTNNGNEVVMCGRETDNLR